MAVNLGGFWVGFAADRPLEEGLPADTMFLVKVSNLDRVLEDMEENPVLALWKQGEVQDFFEPLLQQMEEAVVYKNLKEELGLEDEQFKEMFPGQMVIAMTDFEFKNLKNDDVSGNFIGLVEFEGDIEIIDKLIRHSFESAQESEDIKAKVQEDEFLGAKLWMLEEKDDDEDEEDDQLEKEQGVWAVYDNILMVSTSLRRIRDTISLLDGDTADDSIMTTSTYARMMEDGEESELFVYMNLRSFFDLVKVAIMAESQPAQPNMMGVTTESLWEALAPEAMEGIYVTVDTNNQDPVIYSGLLLSERRGIASLLTYGKGEVAKPDYISKEVLSAQVTLFSLSEFWKNLEVLIASISPFGYQYYETLLDQLKTGSGVDFKASFFNNFEDQITSFSDFGPGNTETSPLGLEDAGTVFIFSLKDRQGFELALESLKTLFGEAFISFAEREYLGSTIFTLNSSGDPGGQSPATQSFSYALTDRYFLLGVQTVSLIEATLARLDNSEESLWDEEDLKEALQDLPSGEMAINYHDFSALINTMFVTMAKAQQSLENEDSDYFEYCLPSKLPGKQDFPYFIVAKSYFEEEGLFSKALIRKRSE